MRALQVASALAVVAIAAALVPLPRAAAQEAPLQVVVLLHHPTDDVDPFGVPYGEGDTFSARHLRHRVADRFDFPTFVADGVLGLVSIPDPRAPFASALANYTGMVRERVAVGSPGTLTLRADLDGDAVRAEVAFEPAVDLTDPGHDRPLRFMAALVEDFIHYEPDARISNGVSEHRFTVRALQDLGPAAVAGGRAAAANASFALRDGWARPNLRVAAWLEAREEGRFLAGEVLQAAWAPANGTRVEQSAKAVLAEMYSATWCTPCQYGDRAAEELAVRYGGAAPLAPAAGPMYFRGPEAPSPAALAALAGAVLVASAAAVGLARRRR